MVCSVTYNGFYINLVRMNQRRQFMESQLKLAGLDDIIKRWNGIDAVTDLNVAETSYIPGHWKSPKWMLSKSEIACFESHRAIWNNLIESSTGPFVVLEDDTVLSKYFCEIVNIIVNANIDFDVIKIDGVCKDRRFSDPVKIGVSCDTVIETRHIVQTIWSSGGYIVSRQGAYKLLQWSNSYSDSVDDFLFCPRPNYALLQLFPAVCIQGMILYSDSGLTGHNSLFRHAEDISSPIVDQRSNGPLLYRVIRETKRGLRRASRSLLCDIPLKRNGGFIGRVPLASDLVKLQHQKYTTKNSYH